MIISTPHHQKRARAVELVAGAALVSTILVLAGGAYFLKVRRDRLTSKLFTALSLRVDDIGKDKDLSAAAYLVEAGADVNAQDEIHNTPLSWRLLTATLG